MTADTDTEFDLASAYDQILKERNEFGDELDRRDYSRYAITLAGIVAVLITLIICATFFGIAWITH